MREPQLKLDGQELARLLILMSQSSGRARMAAGLRQELSRSVISNFPEAIHVHPVVDQLA